MSLGVLDIVFLHSSRKQWVLILQPTVSARDPFDHAQTTVLVFFLYLGWLSGFCCYLELISLKREMESVSSLNLDTSFIMDFFFFAFKKVLHYNIYLEYWIFWHSLKFCTVLTSPSSQAEQYLLTPEDIMSYSMQSVNVSLLGKQMWLSERFWDEKIILDFSAGP